MYYCTNCPDRSRCASGVSCGTAKRLAKENPDPTKSPDGSTKDPKWYPDPKSWGHSNSAILEVCPVCSATVKWEDKDRHAEWHDRLYSEILHLQAGRRST